MTQEQRLATLRTYFASHGTESITTAVLRHLNHGSRLRRFPSDTEIEEHFWQCDECQLSVCKRKSLHYRPVGVPQSLQHVDRSFLEDPLA